MVSQQDVFICIHDSSRTDSSDSIVSALPSPKIKVFDDVMGPRGYLMHEEFPETHKSKVLLIFLTRHFVRSILCLKTLEMVINKWKRYMVFPVFLNLLPSCIVNERIRYDVPISDEERCAWAKVYSDRRTEAQIRSTAAGRIAREKKASELVGIVVDEELNSNSLKASLSNRQINRSHCSIGTSLVVINLLLEIASVVVDQLSSVHRPFLARLSLLMSVLSVVLSIVDLSCKIRADGAFRCKWPIPWFYYRDIIFGSFADTVLLFCSVGHLIVSAINYSFIQKRRDGPIKISVWPLFFAIGMVITKFMKK